MNITSYADFLAAANSQTESQRLLFVFSQSESIKSDGARLSGTLTPVMCVDKDPAELGNFASLVEESREIGQHWDIVFSAALSSRDGNVPVNDAIEQTFKKMIDAIEQGTISNFLAFNRDGELVQFS